MEKTIRINNCDQCPHLSHSGAFTPGGAKPICGNRDACGKRKQNFDQFHWGQRILEKNSCGKLIIPKWCPL